MLHHAGLDTTSIAANASAATVQAALRALSNIPDNDVIVTGVNGGPWTAVFNGAYATLTGTTTGGTSASVGVAPTQTGVPGMNPTLAKKGIKTDSIRVVDPVSGQLYVLGTDYVITRTSVGEDSATNTKDDTYTIQRVIDGGHIDPGDQVQLSYNYTDPQYFDVHLMYDFDDVRDFYGEPFDSSGGIQSELTLAAWFAFTNEASTVICVAVEPADPEAGASTQDYSDALDKLRDEDQVAIVVPATGQQPIQALVLQHVTAQSNNKYERTAILGMDGSATPVASSQRITNAQTLFSRRVALISPSNFEYYAPELNRQITLGGQYAAAAVAGRASSMIASMPLTAKSIQGFVGPTENMREGMKNLESQNGLMVIEKTRRNQISIVHGVTTDTSDLSSEWSITRQEDVMIFRIRDYLVAEGLIGQPIDENTRVQVKASTKSALESLKDARIIENYQNLKVRQIGTQPDVIEVRFEWSPMWPLNYIVVRYSIAVQTGDITISEQTF